MLKVVMVVFFLWLFLKVLFLSRGLKLFLLVWLASYSGRFGFSLMSENEVSYKFRFDFNEFRVESERVVSLVSMSRESSRFSFFLSRVMCRSNGLFELMFLIMMKFYGSVLVSGGFCVSLFGLFL